MDADGDPNPDTIIPIIDGGTEGFSGQCRVVIPKITSCLECSMELYTPPTQFQICTISNTPRTPEHCIAYAYMVQWDADFPGRSINKDSPEDMTWIYERALERAESFGIEGVTYFKTMGLVKSIIPAIASTNAIISAAATHEVLKLVSFCGQTLNNWYAYTGAGEMGIYANTYEYLKKEDCIVCSIQMRIMTVSPLTTLAEIRKNLCENQEYLLKDPSLRSERGVSLFFPGSIFAAQLGPNLEKPISELINHGDVVIVHDEVLSGNHMTIQIKW